MSCAAAIILPFYLSKQCLLSLSAVGLDTKVNCPLLNWTITAGTVQPLPLPKPIPKVITSAEQQTAVLLPKPRCVSQQWLHPALLFVTVQPLYVRSAVSQGRSGQVSSKKTSVSSISGLLRKKKIKNDTCPFQCELTARPPEWDAASLSEPLAALDNVNHAAELWSFCSADSQPLSPVCSAVNQWQKIESQWQRWQAEGGLAEKINCFEKFKPWIGIHMQPLVSVFMALKCFSISTAEGSIF